MNATATPENVTLETTAGTRFTLVNRPSYHPRSATTGVIHSVREHIHPDSGERSLIAHVQFDDPRVGYEGNTHIAARCIRAEESDGPCGVDAWATVCMCEPSCEIA